MADHRSFPRQYLAPVQVPHLATSNIDGPTSPIDPHPPLPAYVSPTSYTGPSFARYDYAGAPNDPAYSPDAQRQYLYGQNAIPVSISRSASSRTAPLPLRTHPRRGLGGLVPELSLERTFFYTLWFLLHMAILIPMCVKASGSSKYLPKDPVIKIFAIFGNASGYCICFDAAFLLLLVSRNFLAMLRATFISRFIDVDKNIHAHKVAGWTLIVSTFVHVLGYYVKFINQAAVTPGGKVTASSLLFGTLIGATGNAMVVVLFIMAGCAVARVRHANFELFYYTHHLFLVFYALLIIHGSCSVDENKQFVCTATSDFWKFLLIPGTIYLVERITREVRGRRPTQISRVVQHPSRVVQIQIKKASVKAGTGQYIYINCPEISRHQWHPFTLTSAPEDDFISIHMRVAGDWTREFAERLGCETETSKGTEQAKRYNPIRSRTLRRPGGRGGAPATTAPDFKPGEVVKTFGLPRIMVDGPFGTSTEHVFDYETTVLIGAGIGVTPFASVLKSLWYRTTQPGKLAHLRKVYFIWICRDIQAFEWFQDLLVALEEENLGDFLEVRAYLTGRLSEDQIRNLAIHSTEEGPDALTGRKTPTYFGRPNFDQIFADIAAQQLRKKVGVFFCGPKKLATTLRQVCTTYSSAAKSGELGYGTQFEFHKEHF
ncbi:hypothetical protein IWQ60_004697 [Tieghemiomyces parasiticus]|uniref:FAD-binding FR-type domain-containing protein n=1 Tax=Tieghemiomyces parasiticus TaxID=78921 RepID=A0A9W8AAW4_9FUNG|nr:hypothetical protein IWQ60_004697 [Tieghemiomyces parasiticus]